jgi:hypothetical protein
MIDIGNFLIINGKRYFEGDYIEFEALSWDGTRCGCNVKGTIDSIDTAHDDVTIFVKDSEGNICSYHTHEIFDEIKDTTEFIQSSQNELCECEIAIPIEEWTEEDGDCLWWKFPIVEPPYCGSPLDCDWQERDYGEIYTHFTRFKEPINQPSTDN